MNPISRAYNYHVMRATIKTAIPGYKGKEPVGCEADMRRRAVAQSKVHLIHKTVWLPDRMTYVTKHYLPDGTPYNAMTLKNKISK